MARCQFCGGNVPAGRGNCPHCGGNLTVSNRRRHAGGWAGTAVPAREDEMFRQTGRRSYPILLLLWIAAVLYQLFGTVFRIQSGDDRKSVNLLRVLVQKLVLDGNILLTVLRYLHIAAGAAMLIAVLGSLSNYIFGTMNGNWGSGKAAFRCLQAAFLILLVPRVLLIAAYFLLLPHSTVTLPAGNLISVIVIFLLFRICVKTAHHMSSYGW